MVAQFISFSLQVSVFLSLLARWSSGFNVDTKYPYIYSKQDPGAGQAYFGYTVTLHSYNSRKSVLVGAPLDNATSSGGSGANAVLEKFGAVYDCPFDEKKRTSAKCRPLNIDNKPDRTSRFSEAEPEFKVEEKSGQWLGGTLHSTGKEGKVVVCAPRYIWRGSPSSNEHWRKVFGRCFTLRSSLNISDGKSVINPCKIKSPGTEDYVWCQAGISAQYISDGDLILGAVGTKSGKGGVIVQSTNDLSERMFSTQDQINKGAYMGYSVGYGHFQEPNKLEYIAGAPRGDKNLGKVIIYKVVRKGLQVMSHLPRPKNVELQLLGSYFGGVLCAVDLNNDKLTDVLVGAPQYSDNRDEGRVFVYINNKGVVDYVEKMTLIGDNRKGARFGSAIASVGDLNKDGFQDVAIGSPYDGPDRRGAVFIYHGTQGGIESNYRQRIFASDISKTFGQPVKMFGHSIAGGLDVDDNKYDDIAVGAFGSENAFLLRTRRIIDVEARMSLSTEQIVLENNDTLCVEPINNKKHKCVNITLEFRFEDKEASSPEGLNISYEISLDDEQAKLSDQFRRLYFINGGERSFSLRNVCTLPKQRNWGCKHEATVFLRDRNRIVDKLNSLKILTSFDMVLGSCTLCPVQNEYKPRLIKKEVSFLKECAGKVCKPNLEVKSDFSLKGGYRELRVGAVDELTVEVDVTNLANDAAYRSRVFLTYPGVLGYIGPRLEDQGVQCSYEVPTNGTGTATCEVGNPLKAKAKRSFGIRFSTQDVKGDMESFFIHIKATSASKDTDETDNKAELQIFVKFDADLAIAGTINRKEIVYQGAAESFDTLPEDREKIGPLVEQTLTVTNNGPSAVEEFRVEVSIPKLLTEHKYSYLLYLLQVEVVESAGNCQVKFNQLNIPKRNATQSNNERRKRRATSDVTALMNLGNNSDIDDVVLSRTALSGDMSRDTVLAKLFKRTIVHKNCNKVKNCTAFTCRFGRLLKGKRADIKVTSRLWMNTLRKENPGKVDLETIAIVFPPDKVSQSNTKNDEVKILLRVRPSKISTKTKTHVWWYILAALGGLTLLAVITFLMYRAGFFRRRKIKNISSPDETEPMSPGTK